MAQFRASSTFNLEIRQDMIDITMGHDTIDSAWSMTCQCGKHITTRSMVEVVDASHWCDGNEGFMHHDPHLHVDQSHYECPNCQAVVTPGIIPAFTPRSMPGMRYATLTAMTTDGVTFTAELRDDEFEQAKAMAKAVDKDRQEWIDAFPCSRYADASWG